TTETLDLTDVEIRDAISFTFPTSTLAPGARTLVVANRAAFEYRYGEDLPIAGEYSGRLNNAGEHLLLLDAVDAVVLDFTYDDTGTLWHPTTDGDGPSLVMIDPLGDVEGWSDGARWRPSHVSGGSPGERDNLLGDQNGDDRVGLVDLAMLQARLGATGVHRPSQGDLDDDGDVDRADFAQLVAGFGSSYTAPVPSPAASPPVSAPLPDARKRTSIAARRGAVDAALAQLDVSDASSPRLTAVAQRKPRVAPASRAAIRSAPDTIRV
ncbi:MAG: dockerin type I domain-containing protein, partial [Pirellulales bacterium]